MIKLGTKTIGRDSSRPYVIAEVGVNHECKMDLAKELIDLAKEGGADGVKFQAYKAETISIVNSPAYWDRNMEPTDSQYKLFKKFDHFGEKEFVELAAYCKKVGVDFLCTPFDFASADFLYPLVPFYKVSSSDLTNTPFLRFIAKKGKPIVLSTGASTIGEIDNAVQTLMTANPKCELALLHCVLNYPCAPEAANLETIELLKNIYPHLVIGYSDHVPADPTMITLTYAFTKGAVILEKHFTHDKTIKGNDHFHSMTADDLKVFLGNVEMMGKLKGSYKKDYLEKEAMARKFARRSIVSKRAIKKGETITYEMLDFKRPATGISPSLIDIVVGSTAKQDIAGDEPLRFEFLENIKTHEA